jgi:hypothetical protein
MKTLQGIGLGLLALAYVTDVEAKVSGTPISELIRAADVIVLAKVVKVGVSDDASGQRNSKGAVAVAEVVETWKGETGKTVKFSLDRTWDCDVSGAVENERVVLILSREYKGPERVRVPAGVHFLSFWGRGRMPIVEQGGRPYARVQGEVVLPKGELEFSRSPQFPGDNLVGLDNLRVFVRKIVAPAAAQQGVAPDGRPGTAARR